jgi:hypothetical protein
MKSVALAANYCSQTSFAVSTYSKDAYRRHCVNKLRRKE